MPTYVLSDDIRILARGLKNKFTHSFGDLNLDKIVFLKELDSKSPNTVATTKAINSLLKVVYGAHDYIVVVFQKRWEDQTTAQKNLHIMQQLFKCKWDGDGLRAYDYNDFYELATAFGNWQDNPLVKDPMSIEVKTELIPKPKLENEELEEEDDLIPDPGQD